MQQTTVQRSLVLAAVAGASAKSDGYHNAALTLRVQVWRERLWCRDNCALPFHTEGCAVGNV